MTATDPVVRTCDKCGLTDSDPHHLQYVAFAHPVSGSAVDLTVSKHVDCCAEDGCPICSFDMQRAEQDQVDIRVFVHDRPADHRQSLFQQFAVETPDYFVPQEV